MTMTNWQNRSSNTQNEPNDILSKARRLATDSSKLLENASKMLSQLKAKEAKLVEKHTSVAQELTEVRSVIGMFRVPFVSETEFSTTAPSTSTETPVAQTGAEERFNNLFSVKTVENTTPIENAIETTTGSYRERTIAAAKTFGAGAQITIADVATKAGLEPTRVQYTLRDLVDEGKAGRGAARGVYTVRCKGGTVTIRTPAAVAALPSTTVTLPSTKIVGKITSTVDKSFAQRVYDFLLTTKNPMTGTEVDTAIRRNNPAVTMATLLWLSKRGWAKRSKIDAGPGRQKVYAYVPVRADHTNVSVRNTK